MIKDIFDLKINEIDRELAVINPESNNMILEIRKEGIKSKIKDWMNEFYEIIPEKKKNGKS